MKTDPEPDDAADSPPSGADAADVPESSRRSIRKVLLLGATGMVVVVVAFVAIVALVRDGDDNSADETAVEATVGPTPTELSGERVPAEDDTAAADIGGDSEPEDGGASAPAVATEPNEVDAGREAADAETADSSPSPDETAPAASPEAGATPAESAPSPATDSGLTDSVLVVGVDITAGRYVANAPECLWERYAPTSAGLDDPLLGESSSIGQTIADILPTDGWLQSTRCGTWAPYTAPAEPLTSFSDGEWVVGSDILPGTYSGPGGPTCRWQRLASFTGSFIDVIATGDVETGGTAGPTQVVIEPSDVGFRSVACGTWTKAG